MEGVLGRFVLGWCPAVGRALRKQFSSIWGQRLLRFTKGLFKRFDLELPQSGIDVDGAWFFEVLPDKTVSCTISDLKWRIWSVVAMTLLRFPIPDDILHLLIASNYLTRQYGGVTVDSGADAHVPEHWCSVFDKFEEVMEEGRLQDLTKLTDAIEELMIEDRFQAVLKMPSRVHPLSDSIGMFDTADPLARLVGSWLMHRLHELGGNELSFEWLIEMEMEAVAGGGGQVEKLVLFYLEHRPSPVPDPYFSIDNLDVWFCLLPRMDWKGVDLRSGARWMMEELLSASRSGLSFDTRSLNTWIRRRSRVPMPMYCSSDASVRIGKLLHSWSRTDKGKQSHQELTTICKATSFVEHVQSTLEAGCGEQRQMLYRAATVVFGENVFSRQFVSLCAKVKLWKEKTELETQEVGEIIDMARRGWFKVDKALNTLEHPCQNNMILYLAYIILQDRLGLEHLDLVVKSGLEDWNDDCENIMKNCPCYFSPGAPPGSGLVWFEIMEPMEDAVLAKTIFANHSGDELALAN